jgi:predicted ATPase
MIDALTIRGFKRFKSVSFPFRTLTVLTWLNGAGKSTALQALLLARQVAENPITNEISFKNIARSMGRTR